MTQVYVWFFLQHFDGLCSVLPRHKQVICLAPGYPFHRIWRFVYYISIWSLQSRHGNWWWCCLEPQCVLAWCHQIILLVKYQVFCCPICPDILRWRWPPAYACNRKDTDCFSLQKYIIALLKAATWEDFTRYIIALLTAAIWIDLRRLTTALLKAAVYYCATESSNQLHFATESDHTNELHSLHILEFTGSRYELLYEKHFSDWLANLALML